MRTGIKFDATLSSGAWLNVTSLEICSDEGFIKYRSYYARHIRGLGVVLVGHLANIISNNKQASRTEPQTALANSLSIVFIILSTFATVLGALYSPSNFLHYELRRY